MKAAVRHMSHASVIDLAGKITVGGGELVLKEKVGELLEMGERNIVLNFKDVSHMDSAGLGELMACFLRARGRGASIRIENASGRVKELFRVVRLDHLLRQTAMEEPNVEQDRMPSTEGSFESE